jgi:hypothetical protein
VPWFNIQCKSTVKEVLDTDTITRIRHCANTGLVLVTEKFRAQVATLATWALVPAMHNRINEIYADDSGT